MNTGVYQIKNIATGDIYVGSAVRFDKRWWNHSSRLRLGTHDNKYLQAVWNKYGPEYLQYSPLLVCSKENLIFYEQRAIDTLNPKYNLCRVAGNSFGLLHTPEAKAKMRGKKLSPEHIAKLVAVRKGRKMPPTIALANSARFKGIPLSKEHRAKIAAANKGNQSRLGHKNSVEHNKKISASNTGKVRSPETRERIGASKRGKPWTLARRLACVKS